MSFKDQVLKEAKEIPAQWLGIHLAHRALGMADAANQYAMGQKREQEAWEMMSKASGMKSTSDPQSKSAEDMATSVIIGDQRTEQHIYNHQPTTTLGKFAKAAAITAALLGSGGAGALATAWLCGMFDKPKPVIQTPVEFPDPDGYGLKLIEDDEAK